MTLYENTIRRTSNLDKTDKIQEAYEKMLDEANKKLACLECDAVSSEASWKKNSGICPKCKKSSKGVAEAKKVTFLPDKHQLKILKDTVKNPAKGMFLGGPSAEEAEKILKQKFGYTDKEIKKLKESTELNEAKSMSVSDFIKTMESSIKKIFPKSLVSVKSSTNLGASMVFHFALGKDRTEWVNGIIQNDPLHSIFRIGWNSFTEDHFIKDKIEVELITGGRIFIQPEAGSHMAFDKVKIAWRKKTDTPEKIIDHLVNYFKKVKQVLMANKDKLSKNDYELNKNKL